MKTNYFIIIALWGMLACSSEKSTVEEEPAKVSETTVTLSDAEMKTGNIVTGKAEKSMISTSLKVSGTVEAPPQNLVSVSFPMGGYIRSIKLLPGMRVSRGQALAELQDQGLIQMQQDYLMARSRVRFLQKEYERQRLLNATKTTSDKVFEQTQSEYEGQRILMNSLREKLRMVGINAASLSENNIRRSVAVYAPISGYVSAVHVNSGKYVNPSDVLFELVNPSTLHLQVKVFEKDLPRVRPGQEVTVTLTNQPERFYTATVALISKNLDGDRSATVHCHFQGSTGELLPGMFASAVIETASHEAITVPEEAVVRWEAGQYVFVEKSKGEFEMMPVEVAETTEGRAAVKSLQTDLLQQILVTKNAYTVLMKLHNKSE